MEFFRQVLISAVADLAAAGLLLAGSIAVWWCAAAVKKRAAGRKREPAVVRDNALSEAIKEYTLKIVSRPESSFVRVLSEWERDFLIEYYSFTTGGDAYDGKCLRLDGYEIKDGLVLLVLSPVGFFDLVTTNLSFFPGNVRNIGPWKRMLSWTMLPKYYAIISERRHQVLGHFDPKAPDLFRRIIANRRLANAVALSLNILDAHGRAIIVKRPKAITVAAKTYAVAVTGTLTEADLAGTAANALARGAAREAEEELGLRVDLEQIKLVDIVMTPQKYQPTALLELELAGTAEELVRTVNTGRDFSAEAERLYFLDLRNPEEFFSVTRTLPFSAASVCSLERAFARLNGLTEEELAKYRKRCRPSAALARRWESRPVLSVNP